MTRLYSSFFFLGVPEIGQNFEQPKTAGHTELFSTESIWVFNKIEKICLSQVEVDLYLRLNLTSFELWSIILEFCNS